MNAAISASELRATAYRLLAMADHISGEISAIRFSESRVAPSPSELAAEAARIYALRRRRDTVLPKERFSDPAWDILLDLFIHATQEKELPTTSVCIASAVNATTALRWIGLLREDGLLRSRASNTDKRVSYVSLTEQGYRKMALVLGNSIRERRERTSYNSAEQALIVPESTMPVR